MNENRAEESTPDGTEPRYRERRSAHLDEGEEKRAAAPADPVTIGEAPEPSTVEPQAGGEAVGEAPERGHVPHEKAREPSPAPGQEPDLDRLEDLDVPDASFFDQIVQPLIVQALQFLGQVPLTEAGERRVLPRQAKHVIDLLGQLEERTRGNLPDEEDAYLQRALSELRTLYLQEGR